jgi:hypothetical protein
MGTTPVKPASIVAHAGTALDVPGNMAESAGTVTDHNGSATEHGGRALAEREGM